MVYADLLALDVVMVWSAGRRLHGGYSQSDGCSSRGMIVCSGCSCSVSSCINDKTQ